MTDVELAWLAGLFEGEGCCRKDSRSNSPCLKISMTDRDVIEHAAALMDGRIYGPYFRKRPNRKPSWTAYVGGDQAVSLAQQLMPLLGERRQEQIKIVLFKASLRLTPSEKARVRWGRVKCPRTIAMFPRNSA